MLFCLNDIVDVILKYENTANKNIFLKVPVNEKNY